MINVQIVSIRTHYLTESTQSIASSINNYVAEKSRQFIGNEINKYENEIQLATQIKLTAVEMAKYESMDTRQESKSPIVVHQYFKCLCETFQLFYPSMNIGTIYMNFYVKGVKEAVDKIIENANENIKVLTKDETAFILNDLMEELNEANQADQMVDAAQPVPLPVPHALQQEATDANMADVANHNIEFDLILDGESRKVTSAPKLIQDVCPVEPKYVYQNGEDIRDLQVPVENMAKLLIIRKHVPTTRCVLMDQGAESVFHLTNDVKAEHVISNKQVDMMQNGEIALTINNQQYSRLTDIPNVPITTMSVNYIQEYPKSFIDQFIPNWKFPFKIPNMSFQVWILICWYYFMIIILANGMIFPLKYHPQTLNLKIASWNCNGDVDNILPLARAFMINNHQDIMFLSETNYDGNKFKNRLHGVKAISSVEYDRNEHPHYGMMLLVLDNELAKEISIMHLSPTRISILIDGYAIHGIYRKHRQNIEQLISELLEIETEHHIIVGDINHNLINPRTANDRLAVEILLEWNLQVIAKDRNITRHPRVATHQPSDIDHIIVSCQLADLIQQGTVHLVGPEFSDHDIISFECILPRFNQILKGARYRINKFEDVDKQTQYADKLKEKLLESDIVDKLNSVDSMNSFSQAVKLTHHCIKVSLNETVGKSSPKLLNSLNLPNLLQTRELNTIVIKWIRLPATMTI
eukprot:NODE_266_length_11332_cov_0.554705.p2 type:complete len:697 gc:universal NODE_266_length_11332_cov_0.554705:6948-9038(+)